MTSPEGNQESPEDRESRESQELWGKDQKFVLELLPTLASVDDLEITHCVASRDEYHDPEENEHYFGYSVTGFVAGHKVTLGESESRGDDHMEISVDGKKVHLDSNGIIPDGFQVLINRMKSMAKDEHVPSYEEDKLGTEMAKEIEDKKKDEQIKLRREAQDKVDAVDSSPRSY